MAATELSNLFSTGGGGNNFETKVQAAFLVSMLTGGFVPALTGYVAYKIKLQGKYAEYHTDDFIIFAKNANTDSEAKLLAQIKPDKLMYERDKLLADVSRLNERIEIMTMDNERMQKTLEEKERVFLPVMLVDGKKMTIDPETNAYVEVKKIAHRALCVGDDGLNCYFDRPLATAIRMAGANDFSVAYPQASSLAGNRIYVPQSAIKPANPGAASFVEPELVPEPDGFRWQNVEY